MTKLLLIAPRFPYPLVGGDRIKNFEVLKMLSRHFEVYFVAISHVDINKEYLEQVAPFCKEIKIFRKSKLRSFLGAFLTLFTPYPLQVGYYYFSDVNTYINKILKRESIQIAIATLIRTAKYTLKRDINVNIVDLTDSIAINYQRSAKTTRSLFWKFIYKIESKKALRFEQLCVKQFDASLFINKNEQNNYKSLGNAVLMPHGTNEALLNYTPQTPLESKVPKNTICFFGKMDYQPNIDAAVWFARNVMPLLETDSEPFYFYIIGANPTKEILELQKPTIQVLGFVKDPYVIMDSCLCAVAPMQSGGGIQNKILESLALGQIVITNALGANPLYQAKDKEHLLLAQSPKEFASTIKQIARNPESYSAIKTNARNFIRQHYTWGAFEKILLQTIAEIQQVKKGK